ncbi:hypothetical protein E5288_WYG007588 [Bos mutus]|uniref:Uncharacterized protein n=1 Tax=Bos mutus TaxID=72004 RepID=A0A6B0R9V6_9CETA|nr:hypothetical protein [Bos mutus]
MVKGRREGVGNENVEQGRISRPLIKRNRDSNLHINKAGSEEKNYGRTQRGREKCQSTANIRKFRNSTEFMKILLVFFESHSDFKYQHAADIAGEPTMRLAPGHGATAFRQDWGRSGWQIFLVLKGNLWSEVSSRAAESFDTDGFTSSTGPGSQAALFHRQYRYGQQRGGRIRNVIQKNHGSKTGGDPAPCSPFGRRRLKKERNVRLNTASRLPTRPFYNTVTQGWDREDPCKMTTIWGSPFLS